MSEGGVLTCPDCEGATWKLLYDHNSWILVCVRCESKGINDACDLGNALRVFEARHGTGEKGRQIKSMEEAIALDKVQRYTTTFSEEELRIIVSALTDYEEMTEEEVKLVKKIEKQLVGVSLR